MTLHSLKIFATVAECGTMSGAADKLFISQPTISQTIAELEKEYNLTLFNRLSRKLFITSEGKQLLYYANNILQMTQEMQNQMKDLSLQKNILLGATLTVGKCVLVDIVNEFEKINSNTNCIVTIDNTKIIEDMLLDSQLDVAIVEGNVKSNELIAVPTIQDELVLICSPRHDFASKKTVYISDLENEWFILRENGSGTRQLFESSLQRNKIQIRVKWTCHSSDSILEAVAANQGISVISYRLAKPLVDENRMCVLRINDMQINRYFSIVYHKSKLISTQLDQFITFVQNWIK